MAWKSAAQSTWRLASSQAAAYLSLVYSAVDVGSDDVYQRRHSLHSTSCLGPSYPLQRLLTCPNLPESKEAGDVGESSADFDITRVARLPMERQSWPSMVAV